jgi:prepilin signal peptidase PulO-like enzyme (type II secretory pathway)
MIVAVAALGLTCGFLVNLLADNLPHRQPIQSPHCLACGAPRETVNWMAILAFIRFRRRCPYCGTLRAWRDVVVELTLIVIALWLYFRDPTPGVFWPALIVAAIFTLIVVIDVEHRLILHVVSVPSGLLILIINSFDPSRGFIKSLAGGGAGFGLVLCMYFLGGVFGRQIAKAQEGGEDEVAFGFGDVMLGAMLGLTVGWPGIILALIFAIFAGGVFSLFYMLVMTLRDRYNAFQPIPYGPFLIFGASLVYFFRDAIVRFMSAG